MPILLTTMVRDEARTLRRMLDSAFGVATHVAVVDTGSIDDTPAIATRWGAERGLPLAVFHEPFQDFGATRTATVARARRWAESLGLDLQETWLLLLDADMVLEDRGFTGGLTLDNHTLEQRSGGLSYRNLRLVRASCVVGYRGRTHEHLVTRGTVGHLTTLSIDDRGDGGCKADKFERDLRLLLLDLAEQPEDPRTLYYLASTYESLGRHAEAIDAYTRRLSVTGAWEEESWMALYRRGIVREEGGDPEGAAQDWQAAWHRRPWRSEPLVRLARLALRQGEHRRACVYARAGLGVPAPDDEALFVETSCYHDDLHQILGIADYYAGRRYDGAASCDALIFSASPHRENALQNATWYMPALEAARTLDVGALFADRVPAGYHPCDPSLLRDPVSGGCLLTLRTVSRAVRPHGSAVYPEHPHTRTLLGLLGPDLERLGDPVELEGLPLRPDAGGAGMTDVRLWSADPSHAVGLGTCMDGGEATPGLYRCTWARATGALLGCERLSEPGQIAESWLPVLDGGAEPRLLCAAGPRLSLRHLDGRTEERGANRPNAESLRGGSGVLPYLGGLLWVAHQVAVLPGQTRRRHLHRLCWIDAAWGASTFLISRPFCFEQPQVERCVGAAEGPDGGLWLSWGREDREVFLSAVARETVTRLIGGSSAPPFCWHAVGVPRCPSPRDRAGAR